jgi:hypothetical protein
LNDGAVQGIAVQSDGRILIVGNFTQIEDRPAAGLARLQSDGRLDTSFSPTLQFAPGGSEFRNWGLAITAENRILVGGPFTRINGEERAYLAELDPDGSLVPEFIGRPDRIPWAFALRPNGRILIGGNFDSVEGVPRSSVAQLYGHADEHLLPTITHPPEDQAVPRGATAVFRVLAEGSGPLGYQWFHGQSVIPGATNASLVLPNVQTADVGSYKVAVRNAHGAVESRDAMLTLANLAVITRQPRDATLLVGDHLPLDLEYSGPAPESWQWYHNAAPLAGATTALGTW